MDHPFYRQAAPTELKARGCRTNPNHSLPGAEPSRKTPGVVQISPHTPGDPESGRIRARYIQSNNPVGNYSAEYPVTVSA